MTTTTLKLPESLKQRIAPLAQAAGKTPHAWMIDALQAQVQLADLRESFLGDARAEADAIDAGGPLYAMEDVAAYLRAHARGSDAVPPSPIGATVRARPSTKRLSTKRPSTTRASTEHPATKAPTEPRR